jgi:hypothetical protein
METNVEKPCDLVEWVRSFRKKDHACKSEYTMGKSCFAMLRTLCRVPYNPEHDKCRLCRVEQKKDQSF